MLNELTYLHQHASIIYANTLCYYNVNMYVCTSRYRYDLSTCQIKCEKSIQVKHLCKLLYIFRPVIRHGLDKRLNVSMALMYTLFI